MATTALDIITGALLNINSYSPGEPLNNADATTALNVLNDLLDSLSTDQCFVYTQVEQIFPWVSGQFQYSIGNPTGGTFVGYTVAGSPVITGVTVPANIAVGGDLTDVNVAVPAGATVTAFSGNIGATGFTFTVPPVGSSGTMTATWPAATGNYLITFSDGETRTGLFTLASAFVVWFGGALTGTPTVVGSVNINTITMSANALFTQITADTFTYTIPGDIKMGRPLRFRDGFTRANTSGVANLDFAFQMISFDRYKEELLKNVQGPWPYVAAYQPTFPYGTLYVYPAPGSNYVAHLFTDLIISDFTATTSAYNMPQGYSRALKKLLALELAPNYGKNPSPLLMSQAKEAKELIKAVNDTPVVTLRFDSAIASAQVNDAGWIIRGGFL